MESVDSGEYQSGRRFLTGAPAIFPTMIRYIIRRLLWAVVLFIAVTLVTFVIFYLIPVDPARLAAGKSGDAR